MMSSLLAAARINRSSGGRKGVLPAPILLRLRILSCERIRQEHFAKTCFKIVSVQQSHLRKMTGQRLVQARGQHGNAILFAFAVTNRKLTVGEVHVLNSQS